MTLAESLGIRPRPYRIPALDGGGIRGITPVVWLERFERHLGGPVHGHFDLIAGASLCLPRRSPAVRAWPRCADAWGAFRNTNSERSQRVLRASLVGGAFLAGVHRFGDVNQ